MRPLGIVHHRSAAGAGRSKCACPRYIGDALMLICMRWFLQVGLERAAEAAADPAIANALRTAWLWSKRMEDRRYARREQEARRTPFRCICYA